jgi:hypothetical protein
MLLFYAGLQFHEKGYGAKRLSEIVQNEWAAPLNVKMQCDIECKSLNFATSSFIAAPIVKRFS